MSEIVTIFITSFFSALAGATAGSVIAWFKAKKRKSLEGEEAIDVIKEGLKGLIRTEIIRQHDKYMARKSCPIYAKDALRRIYGTYHKLGGNDVTTKLYHDIMELSEDG